MLPNISLLSSKARILGFEEEIDGTNLAKLLTKEIVLRL